ncbi:MAG: DUF1385 domain-containing protein [Chloroflexota bacterium]
MSRRTEGRAWLPSLLRFLLLVSAPLKLPTYGGQAVIEGVMMRGRKQLSVAVRDPRGEIVLHTEPLPPRVYDSRLTTFPFIRGLILLWDMLVLGMRTLMFSAQVAIPQEEGEEKVEIGSGAMYVMIGLSMALGLGLFFVVPLLLTRLLAGSVTNSFLSSLVEGAVRLAFFVVYLTLLARLPDVRRTFMYHGAEHKTINAFEAGAPLDPVSVKRFSTIHPRCGTTLLLFVLIVAIFVFAAIGQPPLAVRVLSRIVAVPLIAAACYEWIRFAASHIGHPVVRLLMTPAMALQRLTTREPDLTQLEVSIAALRSVIAAEGMEVSPALPAPGLVLSPQPT